MGRPAISSMGLPGRRVARIRAGISVSIGSFFICILEVFSQFDGSSKGKAGFCVLQGLRAMENCVIKNKHKDEFVVFIIPLLRSWE
jgi:hypothetical protein